MQASTWQFAPTDAASAAIAGMSSCTPCGYCGAEPTTSTRVRPDQLGHRVDVGRPVGAHRRLAHRQAEVVGRLVEGGVRRLGQHDLRFGDATLVRGTVPGPRARRRGSTRCRRSSGSRPRRRRRAAGRGPAHGVGLDLAQRRERLRVERVLVQEQLRRLLRRPRAPTARRRRPSRTCGPSRHLTSSARSADRSAITSSTGRPCCANAVHRLPVSTLSRARHDSRHAARPTDAATDRSARARRAPTLADMRPLRPPHLHRTAAGSDLRRSSRRRPAVRGSSGSERSSAATTTWQMGDGAGLPGPTDAWVTLAGLARETSTIRLGTLVTSATFRCPGHSP